MFKVLKRKSTSEWFGNNWKHLETLSWLDKLCIWLDTCFKIQPGLLLFKYVSVMLAPQHDNEPPTVPRLTSSHDTTCQCFVATQRNTASKLRGVYPKCSLHGDPLFFWGSVSWWGWIAVVDELVYLRIYIIYHHLSTNLPCSWALQL